jgi:hypothetical protein
MDFLEEISNIMESNKKYYQDGNIDAIQNITLIKDLTFDQKVEAIKYVFHNDPIDSASLLNIKILLSGLGIIDSSNLANMKEIWINDLKELCDLAICLKEEIEEMSLKLFYAFIGVIKSLKITINEATKTQNITTTEDLLLRALGFFGMSVIMRKIQTTIDVSEIPCYIGGKQALSTMSNQMNIIELL